MRYVSSYTESPERYIPMTLPSKITSLAIHQSHLLGYLQGYYLVLRRCVIHSFHEEILDHWEYPVQVVE